MKTVQVLLEKIVGGGRTIATLPDGMRVFVWGGLPGEEVEIAITNTKARLAEGVVVRILAASPDRIEPRDTDSYLETSPWQIMNFAAEQKYKAELIREAFVMHGLSLPNSTDLYSDSRDFAYRNKFEYRFTDDLDGQLSFALLRRGSHDKLAIAGTSLAMAGIDTAAREVLAGLRTLGAKADQLDRLTIRASQNGEVAWLLKTKASDQNIAGFAASAPQQTLRDTLLGIDFTYGVDSFFQVNLPIYEQALRDMRHYVRGDKQTVDLYSGIGTIGLTIGSGDTVLIESNSSAVREMRRNIRSTGGYAKAVLSTSEAALEYITTDSIVIVDPPRAGLHKRVVEQLNLVKPERIIYLSCDPVTQARDAKMLAGNYQIIANRGYNFFPRTPHIENLVVLEKSSKA